MEVGLGKRNDTSGLVGSRVGRVGTAVAKDSHVETTIERSRTQIGFRADP